MTMGGETKVRISRQRTKTPTMAPKRLIRSMSVILTALAERTRKMTEILRGKGEVESGSFRFVTRFEMRRREYSKHGFPSLGRKLRWLG